MNPDELVSAIFIAAVGISVIVSFLIGIRGGNISQVIGTVSSLAIPFMILLIFLYIILQMIGR